MFVQGTKSDLWFKDLKNMESTSTQMEIIISQRFHIFIFVVHYQKLFSNV